MRPVGAVVTLESALALWGSDPTAPVPTKPVPTAPAPTKPELPGFERPGSGEVAVDLSPAERCPRGRDAGGVGPRGRRTAEAVGPAAMGVAAQAVAPERVEPGHSALLARGARAVESRPVVRVRDPRPARAGWPVADGYRDARPRWMSAASAAPLGWCHCPAVHPRVRACCPAGWECSLTTPSLHRLRYPWHQVRSRRHCARLRAVCRLHRDSSTARPWSVGRLCEPAWPWYESHHHRR